MAQKTVDQISPGQLRSAIDIIAAAEIRNSQNARTELTGSGANLAETGSTTQTIAPQGLAGVVDKAMGPTNLPRLIDLSNAIGHVRDNLIDAVDLPEDLSVTAIAVLDEETLKIDRYLSLSKR